MYIGVEIMRVLFAVIFLFYGFYQGNSLYAQESKRLDSLNVVINNPNSHDTTIVKTYLELTDYFYLQNIDTAIVFSTKAKSLSDEINFLYGQAESSG